MNDLLDLKHLNLYIGEDITLRNEILTIYREQLGFWVQKLSADMDDEAWYQANHTLKGASRGVGVWAIGDLCEHAETLVKNGTREDRIKVVADLKSLSVSVLNHVDDLLTANAA